MNTIGDPMDKADKLFSTLGSLFDNIRLQRLAVGEPCREDYRNQEDEIVQHLAKLARDNKHDAFPLPASVPNPILVLAPSHRWWTEMPGAPQGVLAKRRGQAPLEVPESDEESGMDTTAPESTDTEMYRAAEQSLLITHDHQALKVQNVARIQRQAEEEARSNIQAQFYEMANQDTRRVCLRRESEEREIEPRCRFSPQHCPSQEERGRSILKKRTVNTDKAVPRQPHSDQGIHRGIGSPLATFPDNRTPMGTGDGSNQQQAFQTALKQCYSDYASGRSSSRKREHTQPRRTAAPTPIQSPAQKNFKVKSTVTLVEPASQPRQRSHSHRGQVSEMPAWRPHRRVPYHLIGIRKAMGREGQDSEKALLLYIMDRFTWEYYSPELNDFGNTFGSKTVFITRSCMAAALYFEVAWARGEKWIFPLIPDLMSRTPLRHGGKFPERPTSSKGRHADDLKLRCREWWMYFLVLLQCWKDETCVYEYGEALRPDSKVLLFIYFHLKNLLKKARVIDSHLYQVKNKTNWSLTMRTKYTPDELTSQSKRHQEAKEEMTAFKEWMYQRYEAEAICEYNDLRASGGDFHDLPHRSIDPIRRPGNKEQFRKERAADQQRMKSAPGTPGVSLDAERQRLCQAESEEWQDYSHRCDEEIRFREGGTPSLITYDSSSPSKATLGASTKKISWAEYQSRPPRDHREQTEEKEAEWHKEMK